MSDLPEDTIKDHYESAKPVYKELATIGNQVTIGNNDFVGWYIKRDTTDAEAIDEGYTQEGRVASLDADLDVLLDRLDRTLYAITTYKRPEAFERWVHCRYEDGQTEWRGEKPTPTLEDLRAVPAWGDIDLADDLKAERGDLDAETRETIEATLSAYVDEYAGLYGDPEAVYALDSVGGAYIFGAPEATLPIADHYEDDADALGRVMGEFIDRANEWLEGAEERVNDRVDGAADAIHPDWVNNLNRQYKAPLAIHSKHDAVVTPLDTDDIEYDLTPLEDVDDDLIERARAWAEDLTNEDHTDCVEHLVATLWPDEHEAEGSWQAALDAWVDEQRRQEEEQQRQRQEALVAAQRREDAGIEGLPITPHIQDVMDAIDRLDIEQVAERTIVHQWTDRASGKRDTSGSGKRAFIPTWGPNAGGTANYIDTQQGIWVDTGQNDHGTAVEMALIATGGWSRGDIAEGEDWARGVDELRQLGFEIPVYTPEAGTPRRDGAEYDQMPYWALRKAAVALEVLESDDLEAREGDDGEPYLAIPNDRYDDVLEAIEEAGLDHGREHRTTEWDNNLDAILTRAEDENDGAVLSDERGLLGYLLGKVSADAFEANIDRAATALDCERADVERHREYEQYRRSFDTDKPVDIRPEEGKMWRLRGIPLYRGRDPILNFEISADAIINIPNEHPQAELVIDYDGRTFEETVTTAVFHDVREFETNLLFEFGMEFEPGDAGPKDALKALNRYIYALDAPRLQGTRHMGLHENEWVVPAGSLSPDGWIDDPQTVYMEQNVPFEHQVALPTDRHDYDSDDVAHILRHLPDTRPTDRLLPVLGWFYAAPFRPYVFEMEGEFNLLNITGDTGSGKTTTLRYLWRCFGMKDEPFSVDDTPFAHTRTMSATNSIPAWYDEYKPGDIEGWKINRFHGLIRKAATGGIEQRGNPDKSVDEYALRAPVVISGEQQIQPPAERRRSIMVTFRSNTTDDGTRWRESYKRLAGEAMMDDGELVIPEDYPSPEDHALAYIRYVTSLDKQTVADRWNAARRTVADYRDAWGEGLELDDLEVQALQTVLFGWENYLDFAERHGVDADELPDERAVQDALYHVASAVGPGGRRVSHLERFIELLSRAAARGYLEEGQEYALVHEGTESEELRFHIDKSYDAISKYVRDHGLSGEDLFNSAHDYRKRIRERHDDDTDDMVVSYTQKTPPVGKCTGINTGVAEERLNFDASAFGAVDEEQSDLLTATAKPIAKLQDERGYQTITATVLTLEDDTPAGVPDVSGTLTDRTGTVDFVAWSRMADLDADLVVDQTYQFKDARIGEYQGAVQVELIADVTGIENIDRGAGHTGYADGPDDAQESLEANGGRQGTLDTSAEPDGGQTAETGDDGEADEPEPEPDSADEPNDDSPVDDDIEDVRGRVNEHLRTNFESGDYVTAAAIAGALHENPDSVDHALDKLAEAGRLLRDDDDTYEVV